MRRAFVYLALFFIPLLPLCGEVFHEDAPFKSAIYLNNYSEEKARAYLDSAPIQPVEGIWYYPDEGMKVAIEKLNDSQFSHKFKYRIVLISASDFSLLPGTVIGYIADSVDNEKFYVWIYTIKNDSQLLFPQRCVATHNIEKSIITFTMPEIKTKLRVNFSRFLPTLLKGINITVEGSVEKLPKGFKRIYPSYDANGSNISTVRYL